MIDLQLVITQEQANVLLGAIVAIVQDALTRHIPDVAVQRKIYSTLAHELERHVVRDSAS